MVDVNSASVMADHDKSDNQDTFDDYLDEEAAMAAVDAAISVNESKGAYDAASVLQFCQT